MFTVGTAPYPARRRSGSSSGSGSGTIGGVEGSRTVAPAGVDDALFTERPVTRRKTRLRWCGEQPDHARQLVWARREVTGGQGLPCHRCQLSVGHLGAGSARPRASDRFAALERQQVEQAVQPFGGFERVDPSPASGDEQSVMQVELAARGQPPTLPLVCARNPIEEHIRRKPMTVHT
jgi:hypothetical protein